MSANRSLVGTDAVVYFRPSIKIKLKKSNEESQMAEAEEISRLENELNDAIMYSDKNVAEIEKNKMELLKTKQLLKETTRELKELDIKFSEAKTENRTLQQFQSRQRRLGAQSWASPSSLKKKNLSLSLFQKKNLPMMASIGKNGSFVPQSMLLLQKNKLGILNQRGMGGRTKSQVFILTKSLMFVLHVRLLLFFFTLRLLEDFGDAQALLVLLFDMVSIRLDRFCRDLFGERLLLPED